ncbi:MAG: hypothetical protein GTO63_30015 [Anaerolineae bacterium]|nr:hypothetical protein [Anaerolineae bacterium]NIQ81841.1 hypothetical protein [Anaerolineae bacterium]
MFARILEWWRNGAPEDIPTKALKGNDLKSLKDHLARWVLHAARHARRLGKDHWMVKEDEAYLKAIQRKIDVLEGKL